MKKRRLALLFDALALLAAELHEPEQAQGDQVALARTTNSTSASPPLRRPSGG